MANMLSIVCVCPEAFLDYMPEKAGLIIPMKKAFRLFLRLNFLKKILDNNHVCTYIYFSLLASFISLEIVLSNKYKVAYTCKVVYRAY